MAAAHGNNNSTANEQNDDSDFQQLNDDIDSIYNTYSSNNNISVETLDSNKNRPVFKYGESGNNQLPSVHISSRLSSMNPSNSEEIPKSAPGTPSSLGSFDFRPSYPRAVTNSSLNVLYDTTSGNSAFKSLVDSPRRNGSDEEVDTLDDGIPRSSEYDKEERNWQEEGAAVKTLKKPNGEVSTIRRSVSDFKFGKELGEGSYSTVVLATDKKTNKNYAVKVLDKRHIIKEKKVKYVNIEKHALNRLSNRMGIISLYFTFQDKDSLYFVLDYASNGELLSLIKKYNTLNEDCTRHFGAQILDAIKYMHDNGVIHRDIKPENILLDDKMRIQITDFGTARLLEKKNDESEDYPLDVRAKSFVGTAEYVSPELLESKFCGKPGDIWAFGCIVYQMIAGKPPFKATNEYLTFQKITKLQYAFSAGFPNIIRDLIKKILVLQPSRRATIPEIQKHFFFRDIDFDDYNQIWLTEPPEIGPYKMTAKSMMKIPDIIKNSTHTVIPKKKLGRPLRPSGDENSAQLKPRNGASGTSASARKTSNNEVMGNVNPANAAAVALQKPVSASDTSSSDNNTNSKDNSNDSKRSSRGSHHQLDYIPGTNILRPQINTRPSLHSYKTSREKVKPAAKQKPNVMEVRPPSTLEEAWGAYLIHPDERVLRIGSVFVHRETTDSFEKKHKGSLHQSPLEAGNTQRSRSGTSLLSQMVNGVPTQTEPHTVDEKVAIKEPYEESLLQRSDSKKSSKKSGDLERSQSTASNKISKRSFFKKLGLSQGEKKDDSDDETVNIFALEKPQIGTMIVTSHGRALVFARRDTGSDYEVILSVELKYPFIRFQELVSAQTKFSKMLPSVGVFTITSTDLTYVFEVEKYEVTQWTEALAKGRTNQIEREKLEQDSKESSKGSLSNANVDSPASVMTKERQSSPSLTDPPTPTTKNSPRIKPSSEKGARHSPPDTARSSLRETPKSSHLLKTRMQRSTPRRKPPPVSPPNETNNTGLPKDSSEGGFLRAARLAVAHNAHLPISSNRRSSFTKGDGRKVDLNKARAVSRGEGMSSSNPSLPVITSQNSKFLARSIRK